MEQHNETNATGSRRFSRVFTKKRLGSLVAAVAIVLLAGGGATYYQHTQARAAHAQERAAMSQLNAIQAEKMGVALLSEAQIRSIAADAIGQEETAVTFDEIGLMTGEQARAGKEPAPAGRDRRKKDKPQEKRMQGGDDDRAPQGAPARAGAPEDGAAARDGKAAGERAMQHPDALTAPADGERPAPGMPPVAGNAPDGRAPEDTPAMPPLPPADAAGQQNAMSGEEATIAPPGAVGAPRSRFTYLVHCTAGGMRYTLRIDAVSGNVFPQSVRAAR